MPTTAVSRKKYYTIVINPSPELTRQLHASSERQPFLIFSDIAGYERWRQAQANQRRTIDREVREALAQLAVEPRFFRRELRRLIELLCAEPGVPPLQVLFAACGSERTLYRIWKPAIPETPARFLGRVRVLHAIRLQEQHGRSAKEAAFEAGFANPTMLRRALNPERQTFSDPGGRNRHTLAGIGT